MNLKFLGATCAIMLGWGVNADAVPIDITTNLGANVVAVPKSVLGDFGDPTVTSWLAGDITSYNSINSKSLPASIYEGSGETSLTAGTQGDSGNTITIDLTGAYDYIVFHWGGQGGGWVQAYDIAGLTGNVEFTNYSIDGGAGNPAVGGFSGYDLFGPDTPAPTPDGGSTVMMLGAALSGLGLLVRRFKR